jgi:hypothetical protein
LSLEFGGALFVVAVGYGAHSFKQKSKKSYGRIEILFATLYASYNIAKVEDPVKPTPRDLPFSGWLFSGLPSSSLEVSAI